MANIMGQDIFFNDPYGHIIFSSNLNIIIFFHKEP